MCALFRIFMFLSDKIWLLAHFVNKKIHIARRISEKDVTNGYVRWICMKINYISFFLISERLKNGNNQELPKFLFLNFQEIIHKVHSRCATWSDKSILTVNPTRLQLDSTWKREAPLHSTPALDTSQRCEPRSAAGLRGGGAPAWIHRRRGLLHRIHVCEECCGVSIYTYYYWAKPCKDRHWCILDLIIGIFHFNFSPEHC